MKPASSLYPAIGLAATLFVLGSASAQDATPADADMVKVPEAISAAISDNCLNCHDQYSHEGELDFESLSFDLASPENFHAWQYAYDRVLSGEMPPDGDLNPDLRSRFLKTLGQRLHQFDADRITSEGRVVVRRLTNEQYEKSLHALLGINLPIAEDLPAESLAGGFKTVAASQQISDHLMGAYLRAADLAIEAAFEAALAPPAPHRVQLDWTDLRRNEKNTNREPEGRPEHKDVVSWATYQNFYGKLPATTADESGWYRIRFRVHAVNLPEAGRFWCTLQSGACSGKESTMYWIDKFEVADEPAEHEFTAWIRRGHMLQLRPEFRGLKTAPPKGGLGSIGGPAGHIEPNGVTGVAIEWVELERVNPDGDTVCQLLFGDSLQDLKPDKDDLTQLTKRFATGAFRRPVTDKEVSAYVSLAQVTLNETGSVLEALKTAYRTVLCSPRFLYFDETPGMLDPFALASRLSYCFWGAPPDEQLYRLATEGMLADPKQLLAQTRRLLNDPRSQYFIRNFTDEWLQLYELESTTPDGELYPEYDDVLHHSLADETHRFVAALVEDNLPIANVVDSNFTFLNSRLAKHYDIDWPNDRYGMHKISVGPSSHRGGLITHASVMKVTANGTTTSPILRGVWMLERIMGEHVPPPPANVPAVEPDIRGAVTIRDQLDKHRELESCAVCHVKIDPPGFALESYDVIGGYRARYRKTSQGKRRWEDGLPVDPSSEFSSGESFDDLTGLKKLLCSKPERIAHSFASQFLTYATGAKPTFADREALEQIVRSAEASDYGTRSMIEAIVSSKLFLQK